MQNGAKKLSQFPLSTYQRWPQSLFQTPTPLLFQNFWFRVRLFFKFENPPSVQTPTTTIDLNINYSCFYQKNDRTDSCYCRNRKVNPDPGPVFHKFLTPVPDPGPKEKRTILPELTPVIQIPSHLCHLSSTTVRSLLEVAGVIFLDSLF